MRRQSRPRQMQRGRFLNSPSAIILAAALFLLFTCSAPLVPGATMLSGFDSASEIFEETAGPIEGLAQPEAMATQAIGPIQPSPAPLPTLVPRPTPSPSNDQLTVMLDTYLTDMTNNGWFQGSVLVARNGTVLLAKGYGSADADRGINNSNQTVFRLASLTKQFTSAAVLRLVAEGKISLDDTICQYIDNCPESWQQVRLRHLLNHSSGIADYTDFFDFEQTEGQPATPEQLLARFRDIPLAFTPGELYDYCNSGYVLLGMVIERVSGRSYADFIQQEIFDPLDMEHSGYDDSSGPNPDFAQGYSGVGQKTGFLNTTTLFAAGGLYSTVWDLYRWDQALYGEKLLPQPLLNEMFTPGNGGYGYGWKIERPHNHVRISHAGNMTGVSNFMARYPDEQLTVIVLSNMASSSSASISDYLAFLVMGS